MSRPSYCPLCGAQPISLHRDQAALGFDLCEAQRLGHKLMHSKPSDVYSCGRCGALFRDPTTMPRDIVARYRDDEYGETELVRIHRAGTNACIADRRWLMGHGIEFGRRVLEVGCYAGGLQSFARQAGCTTLGIDVGRETSAFVRELGFDVISGEFERGMLRRASFDAVFILNCFEQLPRPLATLDEIRRVLRRGGSLVIRTPNAAFVERAHSPRLRRAARDAGVLGVPFMRCLSPAGLLDVLRRRHFAPVSLRGRSCPWMDVAAAAA